MSAGSCHLHPLNGFYCGGGFWGSQYSCTYLTEPPASLLNIRILGLGFSCVLLKPIASFLVHEMAVHKLCQHKISWGFLDVLFQQKAIYQTKTWNLNVLQSNQKWLMASSKGTSIWSLLLYLPPPNDKTCNWIGIVVLMANKIQSFLETRKCWACFQYVRVKFPSALGLWIAVETLGKGSQWVALSQALWI